MVFVIQCDMWEWWSFDFWVHMIFLDVNELLPLIMWRHDHHRGMPDVFFGVVLISHVDELCVDLLQPKKRFSVQVAFPLFSDPRKMKKKEKQMHPWKKQLQEHQYKSCEK